jgi:hypothetical protein
MADYYPLLTKAVAGLPNSTPEARRSIYERARKALFGQLRSLDPPVPEAVIEREARALEEAVARLEVEFSLDAAEVPVFGPTESEPDHAAQRSVALEPARPSLPDDIEPEAAPVAVAPPAPGPAPEAPSVAATPRVESDPAEGEVAAPSEAVESTNAQATTARKDVRRPSVPAPAVKSEMPLRRWIVGAAIGIVVILVASLAYVLRDKPEDVVRPPVTVEPSAAGEGAGGKIVDRIGSGEAMPTEPVPSSAPVVTRAEAPRPSPAQAEPPAAVARRAALLVEAPEEQAKVKIHLGTVVWHTENVNNGPGEPLGTAVRAEIDIPDEKLQAVMTFQKNSDNALPASHVMKLRFVTQPGGSMGNVNRINVPYMRREDAPTGDPLNGVPVPVMENAFLVGLSKGPAEARNLDLVRSREWLDVPMVFANGKIAKLTFEKGTSGQKAIEDALTAWQAQ